MITGQGVSDRLRLIMPAGALETVTLSSRLTGETGYSTESWPQTRRKPPSSSEGMIGPMVEGDVYVTFQLYRNGQATMPKLGDKVTDASSVVWQVKKVQTKQMGYVYDLLCLQNS